MNSRLEEKLAAYEEKHPITNDEELLRALDSIIEEQEKLPPEEKDVTLISEAVDACLSLRGEDLNTLETLSQKLASDHIASKKKRTSRRGILNLGRRGIAVAAAVAVLLVTSVIGFAANYEQIKEIFEEEPPISGNSTHTTYESYDDLAKDFIIDGFLLPGTLPEGYTRTQIAGARYMFYYKETNHYHNYETFEIRMKGDCSWQDVWIQSTSLGWDVTGYEYTLGGIDVIYYEENGRHYAFFVRGDYTYTVSGTYFEDLEAVLSSLEVYGA